MRAARLIKMVLLLQSRPSMTAAELARELEVSERTVTRDAQALSEAGVPVYADRGRAGGYRLIGGYRTRLTGLARSEAEALFLSGVPGALREMGLEDAASAARLKVSAALLPSLRDAPDSAAQRFHLDAPAWFREPETPALLPAVARAVWDDRRVTARYRREGREVERVLEPYGLVLKAGVWYLCARVADGGASRTYRIDRFTAVEALEERFARDPDFDLPGHWAEQSERFARSLLRAEIVVRLSPEGVRMLRYAVDPVSGREALSAAGDPDASGWVTVALPVESQEVAHGQLTALGPEAEVLAPESLRERFAGDAARLAALYGRTAGGGRREAAR
ncbi:YafY family protein [Streptomyces sp. NPDC046759]|uniref:helix-turn-helix transcriptional regulator n=1 Tax=Streptomyces sp. NPDC046759 TaxID=3155019 RepID=UPI0033F8EA0A